MSSVITVIFNSQLQDCNRLYLKYTQEKYAEIAFILLLRWSYSSQQPLIECALNLIISLSLDQATAVQFIRETGLNGARKFRCRRRCRKRLVLTCMSALDRNRPWSREETRIDSRFEGTSREYFH